MSREENVRPKPSLMAMQNVTDVICDFRECARTLWNQHYKLRAASDRFDLVDAYKDTRQKILTDYLSPFRCDANGLLVTIQADVDPRFIWEERREGPQNVSWHPLGESGAFEGRVFRLVEFFDFSDRDYIDLRYALIEHEETEPTKTNRLLADVAYCEFFVRLHSHPTGFH